MSAGVGGSVCGRLDRTLPFVFLCFVRHWRHCFCVWNGALSILWSFHLGPNFSQWTADVCGSLVLQCIHGLPFFVPSLTTNVYDDCCGVMRLCLVVASIAFVHPQGHLCLGIIVVLVLPQSILGTFVGDGSNVMVVQNYRLGLFVRCSSFH